MRRLALLAVLVTVVACRTYDSGKYVSQEDGLMPADDFARYGPEQATAAAIGREFGRAGADSAEAYAKASSLVTAVGVDSGGFRLVITFASGWVAQVNPITDGKAPADTPGLPK